MAPRRKKKAVPPAEGQSLTRSWTVGPKIGEGAQGSVHALFKDGKESRDWVVKLAPLSLKSNSIYSEGLKYQSNFPQFLGSILPNIPSGNPPVYGETTGTLRRGVTRFQQC